MKKNLFKRITALALAMLMVFSFVACGGNTPTAEQPPVTEQQPPVTEQQPPVTEQGQNPENGAKKIISVEKTAYAAGGQTETLEVAYYENESEILLIEINQAITRLFNEFVLTISNSEPAKIEETDTTVTFTRENGSYCTIDFVEDTVFFSDFDSFTTGGHGENPLDPLSFHYKNGEGENIYFQRLASFFVPGYGLEIDLGARELPLDIYEGKKYIALQTFNDLFVSPFGCNIAYNSKDLFVLIGNTLAPDQEEIYYLEERQLRSAALAEFNYNELCLYLDLHYGLQSEHGFHDGFDYYLENLGLKEELLKSDAAHSFNALFTLTMGYIADLHSAVSSASPYLGASKPSEEELNIIISNDVNAMLIAEQKYRSVRSELLGEVEFYQKIGNTAYITFDTFDLGDRTNDYSEESLLIDDTLTLIIAAHAQISQDEEIENVVLDLSCNGGGAVDAAIYVVAWMLGSCEFSVYNSITESRGTINYAVDVNLDGVFDEKDTISDKNLYCITSPVSFSCGNLVPALLKASGNVTILGKTSGGGGCIVRSGVTADGTLFCISSTHQLATVKNGTFYGVDMGVEPDITLTKVESFYERNALTEYINELK